MEVIVQNPNNITIDIDQGRSGRGIADVNLITIGADYYLQFVFTDSTTETVGPIATVVTEVLYAEVRNAEAFTIQKGQPVYLYQAQGNLATVKLASNLSDATSAKTLGLAAENIAAGAQGLVTAQGTLDSLNTSAYAEGDTLYLGAAAGTLTNVKPQAPNHLVYIGIVERANAGAGQIYVRVQNGYELDEIHDVQINSPVNGNTLIYDATTSLWKNAGITGGTSIGVVNGAGSVTINAAQDIATTASPSFVGLTLSGGTANGVLYLDGSKVATSGSALTFDGTSLSVVPDANRSFKLQSYGTYSMSLENPSANAGAAIQFKTNGNFIWTQGASDVATLTSTGLGIGTSSPATRLEVRSTTTNTGRIRVTGTGSTAGNYRGYEFANASGFSGGIFQDESTSNIQFWNYGTALMTLTDSGNLGLGVTPSGWESGYSAFDIGIGGSVFGNTTDFRTIQIGANVYIGSGSYRYKGSQGASRYSQYDGAHSWYTAPSGTAGDTISFTQAMTLDASGNLGVGETSPALRLHVKSASAAIGYFETSDTGTGPYVIWRNGTTSIGDVGSGKGISGSGNATDFMIASRSTYPLLFGTGSTERARITSTGNVVAGGSVALATTATDGFLYVPTCAGTPTGTPTAITGMAPIVVDTTNNKMYFYSGGAWRDAGP